MVTGTTVVTAGVVETGVKVVTSVTGVVLMPAFVVALGSVVTAILVVATVGSGINTIDNTQARIICNRGKVNKIRDKLSYIIKIPFLK